MTAGSIRPIDRRVFGADRLMREHRPRWTDQNKEALFGISCPAGSVHDGEINYSRWGEMALPESVDPAAATGRVVAREGHYDYVPLFPEGKATEWHVNFADRNLFGYYRGPLFAQDEIQVAEHPALGALKEALTAAKARTDTEENGRPTPVLVMGVERRCRIATNPDAKGGRPAGLYGNAFSVAALDSVRRAARRIDPPTKTNLIAMVAPRGGSGKYRTEQVESVLKTAFTGFRAAVAESRLQKVGGETVVVHTGFWGCGVFGGNRILMAILQILAAEMAGVERLVFFGGELAGLRSLDSALCFCAMLNADRNPRLTKDYLQRIDAEGFSWGCGDGN
jgi:poly(ADP-ribose)glycohydrolase PARG